MSALTKERRRRYALRAKAETPNTVGIALGGAAERLVDAEAAAFTRVPRVTLRRTRALGTALLGPANKCFV